MNEALAVPAKKQNPGKTGTIEEITAISAAIYMFLEEAHDIESAVLTIKKPVNVYSPWSSKIYASHNFNRR